MPEPRHSDIETHYPLAKTVPPASWSKVFVGDVCMGIHPGFASGQHNSTGQGVPHLRPMNITREGRLDLSDLRYVADKDGARLKRGDVLFNNTNSNELIGKTCWIDTDQEFAFSNHMTRLQLGEGMSPSFVAGQLHFLWMTGYLRYRCTSHVNQASISSKTLAQTIPFFVPPSREQERIVAKLDALLSRVAAGEAAARRALDRLKKYRAAVLHAAVTGELTRDWRKTNKPTETGEQLLKRLLTKRRAHWEAAEIKRLEAAGKAPKDDKWKKRYEDPAPAKTSALPELPAGWTWASLGELLILLRNGIGVPPNEDSGLPTLRISAVRPMFVDLNERRYLPQSMAQKLAEFALNEGDLLFTRYNGSKDLAGVCGRVPALNETLVYPDKLIRCVIVPGFEPLDRLIEIAANSGVSRKIISDSLRTTAGQWGLSGAVLKEIPIPLPPVEEQKTIVTEVERRLAAAERLVKTLNRQLERAKATRQSLLREAFSGNLVPQDSSDEPASALLERIRAACEAGTKKPKVKKKRVAEPSAKRPPTRPKRPSSDGASEPPKFAERVLVEPSEPRPPQMRLVRLKLFKDFNSLKGADFPLRSLTMKPERLSPICLVGLNGSGKSNLIEVLSEIFCHVELALLPWHEIKDNKRIIELRFELEYQLLDSGVGQPMTVRLEKPNQHPVVFKIIREGSEEVVQDPAQCLALLPTRIIGYSSGLNETISIPYFRTAAVYSDEVLKQAGREEKQPNSPLPDVMDSRTVYLDYECNALILIANYLLQPKARLRLFRRELRIDSISTFDIRFRPTYQGKKPVRLTNELKRHIAAIRSCADSVERYPDGVTEVFRFSNPKSAAARLKSAFGTPGRFFRALYKLSLLNPLALKGKKRGFYLRSDVRTGQLERPPTISREDRIFSVEQIRVNLTKPKRAIDYAGISDGEHQFLQFFGSVLLFDEPGCMFLLDEPETHFNPQWRRLGIQWLANIKSTSRQELVISTHSPFIVSGCKGRNVFKFKRDGNQCICSPVDVETFGASNDLLLARLFDLESMIAGEAIEEMRALLKDGRIEDLRQALPHFGESLEKRFIFQRIAQLEAKKYKRKK